MRDDSLIDEINFIQETEDKEMEKSLKKMKSHAPSNYSKERIKEYMYGTKSFVTSSSKQKSEIAPS